MFAGPLLTLPVIKVTNASGMSKRLSVERKKRLQKIRRISAQKSKSSQDDTFSTDYGEFQVSKM